MTKEEKAAQERSDELIDRMLADHGLGAGAVLGRSGQA